MIMSDNVEPAQTSSIHRKLMKVMEMIPTIENTGFNSHHKYKYVEEAEILRRLRDVLPQVGLSAYNTEESATVGSGEATVVNHLVITDVDTLESITIVSTGYAKDTQDKAVYKARTGATKYGYLKGFCLPTGDDPEQDSPVQQRPTAARPVAPAVITINSFNGTPDEISEAILSIHGDSPLTNEKRTGLIRFFNDNHSDVYDEWCKKYEHEPTTVSDALSIIRIVDDPKVHSTHCRQWNSDEVQAVNDLVAKGGTSGI